MTTDTKIKYAHSGMVGAPSLFPVAGGLISVLDAVLVTGFGTQIASSLSVASGIATALFATEHSADAGTVVLVTGVSPAALNGEKRVISKIGNTLTFDATGVSDQAATGSIEIKVAPLGWVKAYSGTNLASYTQGGVTHSGCFLRVDDTAADMAKVTGYSGMSDISTGVDAFPETGSYWSKGLTAIKKQPWRIFGSDGLFYFVNPMRADTDPDYSAVFCFGDPVKVKANDVYFCLLTGLPSPVRDSNILGCVGFSSPIYSSAITAARNSTGAVGACGMYKASTMQSGNGGYSGINLYARFTTYPNVMDNEMYLTPVMLFEENGLRGSLPGVFHTPLPAGASFTTGQVVEGQGDFLGKTLVAVRVAGNQGGTPGVMFFDVFGPW